MYIYLHLTDNICVDDAIVYISAVAFLIAVFPVHVINYVYLSTAENYASINITLYRTIRVVNLNTIKQSDDDTKSENRKGPKILTAQNWLKLYNKLCLTKIVQLGDFGMKEDVNPYILLTQNALTNAIYTFVKINEGRTKLKNYSILNYESTNINYYLKVAGIINVITLARLFTVFIWGKLYEFKIKQKI